MTIRSFTSDRHYRVDLHAQECSCPHHQVRNAFCKHLLMADGITEARKVEFGKYAAEESVVRQIQEMFRALTAEESYSLVVDVLSSPYATRRMCNTVLARHARRVAA